MDLANLTREELNEEFLRVHRKWLNTHATSNFVDSESVEVRKELDAIIVELQKRRAEQVYGKRSGVNFKKDV